MLKINLLPPYIHQRKQVRLAIVAVTILVAAEVAGMVALRAAPLKEKADLEGQITEKQALQTKLDGLKTQADAVNGEEQSFKPKYDFFTGMKKYNEAYPGLYKRTAGYTYREVMFLDLEASGNMLKFNAYVSDPRDVSRLMLGLTRSGDWVGLPQIAGVPGYSQEQKLREAAIAAGLPDPSILANNLGGMGGSDMPGAGGMGGMMPGGMMMGGPGAGMGPGAPDGPGMAMGGSAGMGAPGMGAPPMGGAAMGPSGGSGGMGGASAVGADGPGMAGGAGGEMGGGGQSGGLAALNLAGARKAPKGFIVTVTCALRKPVVRPNYGSAAQQAGNNAGGGGMGMGGPGGFGGAGDAPMSGGAAFGPGGTPMGGGSGGMSGGGSGSMGAGMATLQ